MKNLFLISVLMLLAQNVFASDFSFKCTFEDDEVISAQADQYTFETAFRGPVMPISPYFKGKTPELFVVEGNATSKSATEEMHFFATNKLPLSSYSEMAVELLEEVVPTSQIESARLAFSTDLYDSFVFVELDLKNDKTLKLSVAGLSFVECK